MFRLFEALASDRNRFLNAEKGIDFEDRVQAFMRTTMEYSKINKQDIKDWGKLKDLTLKETSDSPITNSYGIDKAFIYQPSGSQNYPDFLVFEANEVICIETKYARPPRPVWNSGLPRPNGFYILGSPKLKDITFFRGCDVLSADEGQQMHEFFSALKRQQDKFNEEAMSNQRRGFSVYIRKAFNQGKQHNKQADTDFYNSPNRKILEENVLDYFSK